MNYNQPRIDIQRVIEKLDEYLNKNDYDAALRHLKFWKGEAESAGDLRGKLTVVNEMIGLSRKTDKKEEGLFAINEALSLLEKLNIEKTVTAGTTYINVATAYKAFGIVDKALPFYEKAREIYENELPDDDMRCAALYNNTAITLMELNRFNEAADHFEKALSVLAKNNGSELEEAATYCNLADLAYARACQEEKSVCKFNEPETISEDLDIEIKGYLRKAENLFDADGLVRDGYYAFYCEKCAPTFGYFGLQKTEKKLLARAEAIREKIAGKEN